MIVLVSFDMKWKPLHRTGLDQCPSCFSEVKIAVFWVRNPVNVKWRHCLFIITGHFDGALRDLMERTDGIDHQYIGVQS